MGLSQGLKIFWLLHFQISLQNLPYCNATKTYLRGELFDKGGGVILHYVPYGINVLISVLLLAQEVFSVDITSLLEPFYHPADAEGLFLKHLLWYYAVHLPEKSSYVTNTLEPSKLQNYLGFKRDGLLRAMVKEMKVI